MTKAKASDKPILWLTRKPQGLIPYSDLDIDFVSRYRIGSHVVCTIEQPRDEHLNRRFNGLISDLAKGTGREFKSLRRELIIKAGFYHSVDVFEGIGVQFSPVSVSELDQAEYQDLYDRVVEIVLRDYLPHITREDLLERINRYIGVSHGRIGEDRSLG